MSTPPKTLWFGLNFTVWLALDQATKLWVENNLEYRRDEIQVIPGLFSIVHAQNPGAAFGMLRDSEYRLWVFYAFTAVAVWVVLDAWNKLPSKDRFQSAALGLILSGAIGNVLDRIRKETVTDFLRFYTENPEWKPWLIQTFGMAEWPSFNVADSALLVGVGMFFIYYSFLEDKEIPNESLSDDGTAKSSP
jgi:signal peptidase II